MGEGGGGVENHTACRRLSTYPSGSTGGAAAFMMMITSGRRAFGQIRGRGGGTVQTVCHADDASYTSHAPQNLSDPQPRGGVPRTQKLRTPWWEALHSVKDCSFCMLLLLTGLPTTVTQRLLSRCIQLHFPQIAPDPPAAESDLWAYIDFFVSS